MERAENPYAPPTSELVPEVFVGTAEIAASRMKRLGAVLLDFTILSVLYLATILLIDIANGTNIFEEVFISPPEEEFRWFEINLLKGGYYIGLAIDAAVFFLINGYLLAKRGQSIGKVVVDIAIVNVDTHRILPIGRLMMLRFAPIYMIQAFMAFAHLLVFIVDALFVFRRDRRTLHDMIAGTTVIDLKLKKSLQSEMKRGPITDSNRDNSVVL